MRYSKLVVQRFRTRVKWGGHTASANWPNPTFAHERIMIDVIKNVGFPFETSMPFWLSREVDQMPP